MNDLFAIDFILKEKFLRIQIQKSVKNAGELLAAMILLICCSQVN